RAVGPDRHLAPERPAIELALDVGLEAREVLPHGPRRQRLLEELHRLGISVLGGERPGEGERRELAYLLVLSPIVLAGFLYHPRHIDREVTAIRHLPLCLTLAVGRQLLVEQVRINRVEDRSGHRLAISKSDKMDLVSLDGRH